MAKILRTCLPLLLILIPSLKCSQEHVYKIKIPKGQVPWDFNLIENHHQSPIDIKLKTDEEVEVEGDDKLTFKAYRDPDVKYILRNTGHGVSVICDPEEVARIGDIVKPTLFGGILQDKYIFENVHYHWGASDSEGSEHTVEGKSFSLEGHVVMYKSSYETFEEAGKHRDGIVVFTFFAQRGDEANPELEKFLRFLPRVKNYGSAGIPLVGTDLLLWFLPQIGALNKDYVAYPGSLTTPGYSETVTFVVVLNPVPISHEQLEDFRHLIDSHKSEMASNRREKQALQNRPIIHVKNNLKIDYY